MSNETNSASHEPEFGPAGERWEERAFVPIGGIDQSVAIRGADPANPGLLIVSGPGAAFSPWRRFFAPWEARFTIVHWDQPGAGATFERNGSVAAELSLERLADDAIAVLEHARRVLHQPKISLLCLSGGTIVGLMVAKRRPDLVAAYVGSGQIVDWARQDALSYELLLERARRENDTAAYERLTGIGSPPYADTATDAVKSQYAGAMTPAEAAALAALDPAVLAELQTLPMEQLRARATAAYDALRAQIVSFDARRLGQAFAVPMFFFQGEIDLFTVTSEVQAYAEWIEAPVKRFVSITGAGHSTFFMRDELLALVDRHVRPVVMAGEQ